MFKPKNHPDRKLLIDAIWAKQPRFKEAVRADAGITAQHRGERYQFKSRLDLILQVLRLCWVADGFAAMVAYRLRVRMLVRGIPVLPRILHRFSMITSQVAIGDPVVIHPGAYIIHGQVVIDGMVEIGSGAVIAPWVSIGLVAGNIEGPTIEGDVHVGSGAKLLGPMRIGARSRIGSNAVVTRDVEPGTTVVGIPAKPIG